MQHKIIAAYKKIIAAIMAFLLSLGFTCGKPDGSVEVVRGEANTVTAYDENADYKLSIDAADEIHDISELLYGIFFEDINFAADGGLYAEKVINRSFEYGKLAADDELHGWSKVGGALIDVVKGDKLGGLNENNTNYLVITNTSCPKPRLEQDPAVGSISRRGLPQGRGCP